MMDILLLPHHPLPPQQKPFLMNIHAPFPPPNPPKEEEEEKEQYHL